ncbi:MAG: class I SAM-dependent methyltransferase [Paludibacteraceae bacterium]
MESKGINVFSDKHIAENYDEYYHTEQGKRTDAIEKEIISQFLDEIPQKELLELGCGTGHWTDFFVQKGFKVTGVDISEAMLNVAESKKMNATFLRGSSEALPFEDESFSVLASITMLEFVDDQKKAVSEMYRVLKKGGWLIAGCLNADSVMGVNKEKDEVFSHAKMLTVNELTALFSPFKLLMVKKGVYLNPEYGIIDSSENFTHVEPAFIALFLQKL